MARRLILICLVCKKPRRVCARRRKEIPIIFSGDMCGGENTARLANVRARRVRCSEPQLFQREPNAVGLVGPSRRLTSF